MAKKLASGGRNAFGQALHGFRHRQAQRLRLDDLPEFAANGLRRFGGDDAQAIAERQARLDAADDHVDRVRELRA